MFEVLWSLLSRVFVFVAAGMLIERIARGKGEPAVKAFIWFSLYVLIPVFMVLSLWVTPFSLTSSGKVIGAAVLVLFAGAGFAVLFAQIYGTQYRIVCLPIVFMNSAYLAIPVCALLWGASGVTFAILYNAVVTLAIFTFGIWWVSPKKRLREIIGLPAVYATIVGIGLNMLHIRSGPAILSANGVVSSLTMPVMLLFVGYRLGRFRLSIIGRTFSGVILRMGGGVVSGIAAVKMLGISGDAAGVVVLVSLMPAAVNTVILAEYFDSDAEFAAASVFLGTLFSLFLIPVAAIFLRRP